MDVTFTDERPFPGWDKYIKGLLKFPPLTSLVVLANTVHRSAMDNDGIFANAGTHNRITHQVFQRLMLGLLCDSGKMTEDSLHPDRFRPLIESGELSRRCEELLGLRSTHPAFAPLLVVPAWFRKASALWFSAMEQSPFVGAAKIELARTWMMYEEIWRRPARNGLVPLDPGSSSAFTAPKYTLFLGLVLWHHGGYVENPELRLSAELSPELAAAICELFTVSLDEFLGRAGALGVYPQRFKNPFMLDPVIRLPNGALLAPDPTAVFSGFEGRILQRALGQGAAVGGEEGFQRVSTAFGKIFEEYGRCVLRILDHGLAGQAYQDEFPYMADGDRVDSPDAFVLGGDTPLVFEFKSVRHPFDADAEATTQGLTAWLNRVLGMKNGRDPLVQGLTFLDRLARAGTIGPVSQASLDNYLYLLVTYDEVPWCANWPVMRAYLWPDLGIAQRDLLARAAFVSIRDIEVAATVAHFLAIQGAPRSLGSLVREWWADCQGPPATIVNGKHTLLGSLATHLVERYPEARRHVLPVHQDAFLAAFREAADAGFPIGGVEEFDARA